MIILFLCDSKGVATTTLIFGNFFGEAFGWQVAKFREQI